MGGSLLFTEDTLLPARNGFLRLLQQTAEQYDPVEKLLSIDRELVAFEQKHGMLSTEFYERFEVGELGDAMDFIRWAGRYELYVHLKEMISAGLNVVVTETRQVYA